MAAYSAVVSFRQLLGQLLDSDQFSLSYPNSELQSFYKNIRSLEASVQRIFPAPRNVREAANILQIEIRDAIYQAQDAVENFIIGKSASLPLQELTEKIDPITAKAKKLVDSFRTEGERNGVDDDIPPPPRSSLISRRTTRIVGQERDKELMLQELLNNEDRLQVLPITGMGGVGKTTLARSIYSDPKIRDNFLVRCWVTVSQDYNVRDILERLLNSIESRSQKAGERVIEGSDGQLRVHLRQSLSYNKYLVVIDDVWDREVWDRLRDVLPDNKNGSRIIITTRILGFAKTVNAYFCHEMRPLDEEYTWILLCEHVFGGMHCPPPLEIIGRKIATNCRGLPLSVSAIGGLLSQERQAVEYWRSIEEDTNAALEKEEGDYSEILSLSYNQLPSKLRGCFLYLGAFPEDSDIALSKLTKLWLAEGFLVPSPRHERLEQVAEELLLDLIQRNLVTVRKISSDGRIKTCGLHNSLRDLAVQESTKEKFFHSRKKYAQRLEEDVQMQRRVSVHKNILMCLEEVYFSTRLIENARSLLYVGPHHHHPLPFCLTFDLLRVLDAFTVYFIDFPHEFLKLIHLRYLSFTYNDDLSPNISQLQKLQVLMVRREPRIIFVGVSFLPDEIWEMPQLRHLWFTETDFPAPPPNNTAWYNLQSLKDINAASCTREVLQSMPNLKKLGMWVEAPGVVGLYLDELEQLEAFKFTVLNPTPKKQVEFQPELFFPPTLRKLSLSGCGLPWEDMEVIAQIPSLEVLKLRELAFHGDQWHLSYTFENLKFLRFEYLNFKEWIADDYHFPSLEQLLIRHCYQLKGIPSELGFLGSLNLIELVDCSPSVVESAENIENEQAGYDKTGFQVRIYCSYFL